MKQVAALLFSATLGVFSERLQQPHGLVSVAHHLRQASVDSRLDPELQGAIDEANEVSRLSDEIQRVEMEISEWKRRHAQARQFHEGQMDSLKQQVEIRKEQQAQNSEELDGYKEEKRKHYKYLMCSYILDAYFFGDEDKKLHTLHLCMGRKSLALHVHANISHQSFTHHAIGNQKLIFWDSITTERLDQNLMMLDRRLSALDSEVQAFAARCGHTCKSRGPVETMRARLRELEAERDAIKAQYYADKARWKKEREELGAEEDDRGNDVVSAHHEKARLRKEAWQEVKSEFCPVIDENYGINEDKIVDYATVECQED